MVDWNSDEVAERLASGDRRALEDPELVLKELDIREGAVVADLGCGSGYFTLPMAMRTGSTGRVYAVDSSPNMLAHLTSRAKELKINQNSIEVIEADLVRTRIPDKSIDIALFANVLHDLSYVEGFINEVKRILKPSGRAVDYDWNRAWKKSGPPMDIRLDKNAARSLLEKNGLRAIRSFDINKHHYMLICELDQ